MCQMETLGTAMKRRELVVWCVNLCFLECNFIILKHTCRIEIARIGGIV